MDRAHLEKLANSSEFIHRMTRDDIKQIVKMLDASDAEIIDRNDARSSRSAQAYELAAELRTAARVLKTRADELASYLDQ
jgi:hypothetical protein